MKKPIGKRILRFLASVFDAAEWRIERNARAFFDRSSIASEDDLVRTYDRDRLIAQTRDLSRNNPIVAGFLSRLSDMTLGQGIEPRPTTSSQAWNEAALALWRRWAIDPEGRGLSDLKTVLALCVIGLPMEGGAAIIKHTDGTIEPVELSRFRPAPGGQLADKPYKTDDSGRITHWCIWGRDQTGGFSDATLAHWVPARDVLTMFSRTRPDQVMPTPELAPAVNIIRDMKELNDYTLRQAKVQSAPALIHNQADEDDGFPVRSRKDIVAKDPLSNLSDATGLSVISTRGDVKTLAPATPSSTYDQFQRYNLKLVAMAMSIPLDVLMLWFSDGTYSSSKATLTQAHEAILQRQNRLIERILRPLWQWKMAHAVANGLLPPPPMNDEGFPAYDYVDFRLPAWEWMDAQDQTQTEAQEVLIGVRTLGEMARKRGHDLYDVVEERAQEMKLIADIAAKYGLSAEQLSQVVLNGGTPPAPTVTVKTGGTEQ